MCSNLFKKPKAQTVVQEVAPPPKAADAPSKTIEAPTAEVKNSDVVSSISNGSDPNAGRVRLGGSNKRMGGNKVGLRI
ncbi:hypothetical protein CPT_Palo_039 [Rhizobium phage Palo]|uniref:Uncharacterized protein n=1 Tax=Rhizobium phage Palo TaxID=2767573 RepID=A0A7L8G6Z0_9CAUD|nr:hypothetical protein CPT_Palo_039 [Rhizobium phage Palo]